MQLGRRARVSATVIVAVVGVVLVLVLWSSMGGRGDEAPGAGGSGTGTATEQAERVGDGATTGPDASVRGDDGTVYRAPTAKTGSSSDVLVVEQTMVAPDSDGTLEVVAPEVSLVTGGGVVPADVDADRTTSRRTTGGGVVGFIWTFTSVPVDVGDTVTLRVRTPDGLEYDVEGVEVTESVRKQR